MSGLVDAVAGRVCDQCHVTRCNKEGCLVSLNGAPRLRVIVDMDCKALQIPSARKRCDYLFVGEENTVSWVVPMELKSGGVKAKKVVGQLQGGARTAAEKWLPPGDSFQFVPVLVHCGGIHPEDRKLLRSTKIKLRGKVRQTELLCCGGKLKEVLKEVLK